jgi:Family of unknown function (DUF6194)
MPSTPDLAGSPPALPAGPDAEAITRYIVETFDDVDWVTVGDGTFFSCNSEHWPNFATLTTGDEFDQASDLDRPGVFRLNVGVLRPTFDRLVSGDAVSPDFTAFDTVMPHPVYAAQRWISIINPSGATFEEIVKPLLEEAHELVSSRERRKRERAATS